MLFVILMLFALTLSAQGVSNPQNSNIVPKVSLFVDSINKQQLGSFGTFADRTINQILQCATEQEASLLMDRLHVYLAEDGKGMNKAPRKWVQNFLRVKHDMTDLVFSSSATYFTISWGKSKKEHYVFKAVISRETIEGTDKAQAEELLFSSLLRYKTPNSPAKIPEVRQLIKTLDTDLLVLKGNNYMTSTMNSDTYYMIRKGNPVAVFDKKYPVESLKNLVQGKVKGRKYKLSLTMPLYGGKSHKAILALDDVLSYWLDREKEYDVYCGVYSAKEMSSESTHKVSIIISHRQLQYVNVLSFTCYDKDFDNPKAILEGILTAIIPQHNIDSLLK